MSEGQRDRRSHKGEENEILEGYWCLDWKIPIQKHASLLLEPGGHVSGNKRAGDDECHLIVVEQEVQLTTRP